MPNRPSKKTAPRKPELVEPHKIDGYYIAAGGDYVEAVLLTSSSPSETSERVHVKLLEESAYELFFGMLDRSSYEFADFVCQRESGWSRRFHPLSVQLIKARGLELNFTSAQQWADNQTVVTEALIGMMGKVPEKTAEVMKSLQKGSAT